MDRRQDLRFDKLDKWWHREYREKDGLPNGYIDRRHEYLYQVFVTMPDETRHKIVEMLRENLIGNWPSDCEAIAIEVLYQLIREDME